MLDSLYHFFRGSIGFSLLVAGFSLMLAHGPKERAMRAFAHVFMATGMLFCLSALDKILMLPLDLDNFLLMGLTYITGRSLLEIALFLFGNERRRGAKKKLNVAGAIVTAALCFLPFLDYAFGWQSIGWNVEDGLARGPIHAFSAVACYAWPLAVTILAVALARWKPSDLPIGDPEARKILVALAVMVILLAGILVSLGFGLKVPYRICHISLEGFMLAWYFYVVRHPHYFVHVRDHIGKEHKRRFALGKEEAAGIHAKLEGLARNSAFFGDENLDLASLADRIGVPSYRLSRYFSARLGTTFPAWLNELRVAYVRKRMVERPEFSILEISIEAGYKSKTAFNAQFSKIVGMSPSEYRGRHRVILRSDS